MAKETTIFVHGEEEYKKAIETTEKLFANKNATIETLTVDDVEAIEGIVKVNYNIDKINSGLDIINFLAETQIFPSKGEARKMILNGGVSINRKKIDSIETKIDTAMLLHGKYLLVQKGRRNYYLVIVE